MYTSKLVCAVGIVTAFLKCLYINQTLYRYNTSHEQNILLVLLILWFVSCTEFRKQDTTGGTSLPSPVCETQPIKEVSQDRTTSMSSAIYESPIQESISG